MATTTTEKELSPLEFGVRLQELLKVAADYAAAEAKLRRLGSELAEANTDSLVDGLTSYQDAVVAEIKAATWVVSEGADRSGIDALYVCQSIQNALDVLKFSIERSDLAS